MGFRGSVYKLHIYRRPLLDDYKEGKRLQRYDLQLIMCGDMFKKILSQGEALKIVSFMNIVLEDPSNQGRSLIKELDMDAGIYLVPPHAVDEGRNDDTQIYDLPAEQFGVFSAATALADAAKRRRSVETAQTYTRRRRSVSTGSSRVSTGSKTVSTASELGSTIGVKAKDKGKAIMQESEPPKKVKKRVQVQMSMDEELAKKV
ncbi:hypothetical protein Tco_0131791, partial [Tanacetum coccineum]